MKRKFYKVLFVNANKNQLESACQNTRLVGSNRENVTVYPTETWVKPHLPNSKLFVFDNLDSAKRFREDLWAGSALLSQFEIWEVSVKNPMPMPRISSVSTRDVARFWVDYLRAKRKKTKISWDDFGAFQAPRGTFGVSSLKLVQQIF